MSARLSGKIAALWGLVGFLALIADALWRLTPVALDPILAAGMVWHHWLLWAIWLAFMLYTEAYKGFHLAFAPRFAVRARHLAQHPKPLFVLLAPLFCMGMIHATKKRLLVSWGLVVGIVALVVWVRTLDQPWRGIVDGGVVVGLFCGTLSILWYFVRAWRGEEKPIPPDIPGF